MVRGRTVIQMKDKLISEHRLVEDLYGCLDGFDFDLEDVLNVLKGVEPVDAVPVVHGNWISIGEDKRGYAEEYECSVCKNHIRLSYYSTFCDYEYCPNCGAKMGE